MRSHVNKKTRRSVFGTTAVYNVHTLYLAYTSHNHGAGGEMNNNKEESLLDKLDSVVPAPLAQFDAFPKLPSTYKARSESRGFMTIFVLFLGLLLVLNDIGEYIWGWPDYEFNVDKETSPHLNINLDMTVNMQCRCK